MLSHLRWVRGTTGLAIATSLLAGCQSGLKPSQFTIEQYVTAVTDASGTIGAALHAGPVPVAGAGPTNTVAGFAAMVNGGSSQQTVTGAAAFTRIVVAMPGMDNYYELTLPSTNAAAIILRASPLLGDMSLPLTYAVGDAGTLGAFSSQTVRVIGVGTGDVQVSVSWSDSSDVDLHVIEPSGEEIYYGHGSEPESSATGGTLDLDSNAACTASGGSFKSNENVVWPNGAPHGTYTVKLDYWSSCTATRPTEYVVTIATISGTVQVFTGTLSGPGDRGGAGSGQIITTFVY